jgi:hypothetical protein
MANSLRGVNRGPKIDVREMEAIDVTNDPVISPLTESPVRRPKKKTKQQQQNQQQQDHGKLAVGRAPALSGHLQIGMDETETLDRALEDPTSLLRGPLPHELEAAR